MIVCKNLHWKTSHPCTEPSTCFYYTRNDNTGKRTYYSSCNKHTLAGRIFKISETEYVEQTHKFKRIINIEEMSDEIWAWWAGDSIPGQSRLCVLQNVANSTLRESDPVGTIASNYLKFHRLDGEDLEILRILILSIDPDFFRIYPEDSGLVLDSEDVRQIIGVAMRIFYRRGLPDYGWMDI